MLSCPSCKRALIRRVRGDWCRWCKAWRIEEFDPFLGEVVARLWIKTNL